LSQPVHIVARMDSRLFRLESTLASQDGLVTLDQLRAADIDRSHLQRLVRRKVLRQVRPRVYALIGAPDTWRRGLRAVVLSADGIASHSSAAKLWLFATRPEGRYEITLRRAERSTMKGVVVHRSSRMDDEDMTQIDRLAVTSFERTVCDCTTLLSKFQLSRVLDDGLRRQVASLSRLASCAERLESAPGRHMTVVRTLLAQRGMAFDPGGSRAELNVLAILRKARVPLPVQQHRVVVDGRTYILDYAWPELMVFGEFYGLAFHSGPSAVAHDSERLTALVAAGWLPLIFTESSSERDIVNQTIAALRQRGVGAEMSA
jgi:hypothetical protein